MFKKAVLIAFAASAITTTIAQAQTTTTTTTTSTSTSNFVADGKLWSSAYQQKAAEYKALCFQAYNMAHLQADMALLKNKSKSKIKTKPLAIVTDIDETVLDNSPNSVHQALQGKDYEPAAWAEWTAMAKADTVPGAPSFLKYAASKGITIFYITNRAESERAATLKNLQLYDFPNADNAHLILHQDGTPSSKETRRQEVSKTHNIIMLMGDNLADFSAMFDKKTTDERNQTTREHSALFGKTFIVIPNANYGDWESSIYQYKRLTAPQKEEAFKAILTNQ